MKHCGRFPYGILLLVSVLLTGWTPGARGQDSVGSTPKESIEAGDTLDAFPRDPLVAEIDSIWMSRLFRNDSFTTDTAELNTYGYGADSVPTFSDSVYRARMEKLNGKTPIELNYNSTVKAYIKLYTKKRRELTSRVLGLAEQYFPLFEEKLDQKELPLELKYLPVIESALNPKARSRAGATGLWQFMYHTGNIYDLKVTSYIDQRKDPLRSTIAASQYLNFLYGIYDDWQLVLAAYNMGPGNLNKAIRRSGGVRDYWQLRPFLPSETRGYIPAFTAVAYTMNFAPAHNLYPDTPDIRYFEYDTLQISKRTEFENIHAVLDIPMDLLEFLNPAYKMNKIPESDRDHILRLPRKKIGRFIALKDSIYNYQEGERTKDGWITKTTKKTHRVKRGEFLGAIADRYNCSVKDLMYWNDMRRTRIHPGQLLTIKQTVRKKVAEKKTSQKKTEKERRDSLNSGKKDTSGSGQEYIEKVVKKEVEKEHVVKRGEFLERIADQYDVSIADLRKWNGLRRNRIYPGQSLTIRQKEKKTVKIAADSLTEAERKALVTENPEQNKEDSSKSDAREKRKKENYRYYTVQKGDTLWDIAKKYQNTNVRKIKKLNDFRSGRWLTPGQRIRIDKN